MTADMMCGAVERVVVTLNLKGVLCADKLEEFDMLAVADRIVCLEWSEVIARMEASLNVYRSIEDSGRFESRAIPLMIWALDALNVSSASLTRIVPTPSTATTSVRHDADVLS